MQCFINEPDGFLCDQVIIIEQELAVIINPIQCQVLETMLLELIGKFVAGTIHHVRDVMLYHESRIPCYVLIPDENTVDDPGDTEHQLIQMRFIFWYLLLCGLSSGLGLHFNL